MPDRNDEPRICIACKQKVQIPGDEDRMRCPKCNQLVWFFHYRTLKPAKPIPSATPHSHVPILIAALGVLSLVFALATLFHATAVILVTAGICGAAALTVLLEHKAAVELRTELTAAQYVFDHNKYLASRFQDARRRYGYVLGTQEARIATFESAAQNAQALADAAHIEADAKVDGMRRSCLRLGERYISDHVSWLRKGITANPETFLKKKHAFESAIAFARSTELPFNESDVVAGLANLNAVFNQKVQKQRVAEELRAAKKLAADRKKAEAEVRKAQAEEAKIASEIIRREAELESARRADATKAAQLVEQLESMQQELIAAKDRSSRAVSNAQRTKVGWVYILSNIGSFGDGVFKIGLTRCYDYMDRIKVLSGASVPFPFDVHAAIHCADAPGLEHALHKALAMFRVNRANPRKEFFRCSLQQITAAVEKHHGATVDYTMEPEASQWWESQDITDEQLLEDEAALEAAGLFGGDDDEDYVN